MAEQVDCVVIGAGVVGLACARVLGLAGREVLVLESAGSIGTGTSSRNSEVVHAGIYYTPGSLKARFCVAGKKLLYAYCQQRGIAHRNCGKLIVATNPTQMGQLAAIIEKARANGVMDLQPLTREQAIGMEPALECLAALYSPSTGIIDSHAFMLALQGDAENAGAVMVFHSPVTGGRAVPGGVEIDVGGAEPMSLRCRPQELMSRLQRKDIGSAPPTLISIPPETARPPMTGE